MWKSFALSILVLLTTASCTWVSLTRQGDNVRVVSASDVQGCKSLGQTKVSVRDFIVDNVKRDERKVARELTVLGRNSAAEMNGDTITPASEVVNGAQAFDVFRCMP
ncbi:MAG: DUF4156 domain-containing protein [Desulfobulbaceae bacterium]|nr:DUF4156 domain-containing protein [Desulfobulbaceae bacterium]